MGKRKSNPDRLVRRLVAVLDKLSRILYECNGVKDLYTSITVVLLESLLRM